jgi:phosphotransacetylase
VGDTLTVTVTVVARDETKKRLTLACACVNQAAEAVIEGEASVLAPTERIERPAATLPEVRMNAGGDGLPRLLAHVQPMGAIRVAVVHPCDALSLGGALDARAAGLIEPVLVGPRARVEAAAAAAGLDLTGVALEDVPHSHAAAARAAELAGQGRVEALMKGSLHTDELMGAVVSGATGLRTARRLSHCFVMDVPGRGEPLIITDAAINIIPDLAAKRDIVQNAIDLARVLGFDGVRVAILAAVETVSDKMPSTIDAAALCKMADRGQISGAVLDGPLGFDNAVSLTSATTKGIVSLVAGEPDILVVPNLDAGNSLYKSLVYLGGAACAGLVLGARVPIILTSRADSVQARIASCALATLAAARGRTE